MRIFSENDFLLSEWEGGTTQQLFIYPESSNYSARNFKLRISVARVDLEESKFTSLPSYKRKLMILEGGITLRHEGRYSKHLEPFESDEFDGSWITCSKGKCTDFNVMYTNDLSNELRALRLSEEQLENLECGSNCTLFIYVLNGSISVKKQAERFKVNQGCLLRSDSEQSEEINILALQKSDIILTIINPAL